MTTPRALAGIGIALQYATQIQNLTARELAVYLIDGIQRNETSPNGLKLLGSITKNPNITADAAIGLLGGFSRLSTDKRHNTDAPWLFMMTFTFVILVARLYSRQMYSGKLRSDDWVMILGWIFASGFTSNALWLVYNARLEHHVWDTSLYDIKMHSLLAFCDKFLNLTGSFFVKISLLLFYYQISTAWPKSRWLIHFTLFTIITYHVIALTLVFVACAPLNAWDNLFAVKCRLSTFAFYMFLAVYSVLTDLLILAIPMLITWRLNLGLRDKVVVMGLFGLGFLAAITGIVKATTLKALTLSTDLSYDSIPASTWTIVEMYIPVFCSSVPALRNLLLHYFPRALGPRIVLPPPESESESPSSNTIDYNKLVETYAHPTREQVEQVEMQRTQAVDSHSVAGSDVEAQKESDAGVYQSEFASEFWSDDSRTDVDVPGGLRATPPRVMGLGKVSEALRIHSKE